MESAKITCTDSSALVPPNPIRYPNHQLLRGAKENTGRNARGWLLGRSPSLALPWIQPCLFPLITLRR